MGNLLRRTPQNAICYCNTNCDPAVTYYHWNINNFSLISLNNYIESAVFSTSNNDKVKWKLCLYRVSSVNFSIYLRIVDYKDEIINVLLNISIMQNDGSECKYSCAGRYKHSDYTNQWKLGFYDFLKLTNKSLCNDTLRIKCNIKWSTGKVSHTIQNVPILDFNHEQFDDDLSKDIKSLFKDERFSDVCIEVEDCKFMVHKNILAVRSSVFSAMFEHNMKENLENVVKIQGMKPVIVKAMLRFIYTGQVESIGAKAIELLKAAEMYDLKGLKLLCENKLVKSFTVNNVAEIISVADAHNAENVKREAINFIKYNLSNVFKNPSFLNFPGSKSCLIEIFKSAVIKN